ncbi:MAG: hypothetical protein ABI890_16105 [Lapillicoccus sp.]
MDKVFDVRRFTALDMFGTGGTLRRRRIVRAEFVIGCPVLLILAVATLRAANDVLGVWFLGLGVNYLPLAVYAVSLFPPGRVEDELSTRDDLRSPLKSASAVQVLLLVPFLVGVAAAVQFLRRGAR